MCGIAGIYNFNNETVQLTELKKMTEAIAHRGPDGEGQWISEEGKIGLGHRRLSIIDLSESANQPLHYIERYSIVFNGEIYNYLELREDLIANGYSFNTHSDTEVLSALYDFRGHECLQLLDGMFAFAIWDKSKEELFCARDRFGEKPFYYSLQNDQLFFASEMKAIWAAGVKKVPNENRIFRLLAYNTMQDSNDMKSTFFESIFILKPSHYMVLKNNSLSEQKRYWDIDLTKKSTLSYEDATQEFKRLFDLSVSRRLRSDVPIGSSLSGGLDSSSIVCTIEHLKENTQQQKTFSARFEGFIKDEGEYIDVVNKKAKTEAHSVFLNEKMLEDVFDKVAFHQEEPFGSKSILAQYHVMKLAKENDVTVLLDGQGADEYLSGYPTFYTNYFSSLRKKNKSEFEKQLGIYKEHYNIDFQISKLFFIDVLFPKLRNHYRTFRNFIKSPAHFRQFSPEYYKKHKKHNFKSAVYSDLNTALYHATLTEGLSTLLRYADRNSMANSREVRLPFLNHELVEFVFSLPDDYKIRSAWTKAILRNSMNEILPESICWRKEKVGFEPPKSFEPNAGDQKAAIELLIEKGILHPNNIIRTNAWNYVQIAKLYS